MFNDQHFLRDLLDNKIEILCITSKEKVKKCIFTNPIEYCLHKECKFFTEIYTQIKQNKEMIE